MTKPAGGALMPSLKLIVVGESGTGKSSMLHRFIDDVFNEEQTQTIGVEFGAKVVTLSGQRCKITVWDTAGQERYRSVTRSYYRGAAGGLIVYDVCNRDSYERVPQWLADVRQLAGAEVTVMLIGNKSDIAAANADRRKVTHMEASVYAQENGIMHIETSASTGEFVAEAFLRVAKATLLKMNQLNPHVGALSGRGGASSGSRDDDDDGEDAAGAKGGTRRAAGGQDRTRLLGSNEAHEATGAGDDGAGGRPGAVDLRSGGGGGTDGAPAGYCARC
jgi:small GTP-binding protein